MAFLDRIFSSNARNDHDELRALLPTRNDAPSSIPSHEVTKTALRLKHQIETVIPIELEVERVTKALSPVLTTKVIQTAREAGGKKYPACVVYCLLVCKKWFKEQAKIELWDADLHEVRAVAAEYIAKKIIESEEDTDFLLQHILLQRFAIEIGDGEDSISANVIERAVDLHSLTVIGSSGYQKCVNYMWRGWLVQDDSHPARFVPYKEKVNTNYWAHLHPDRMRVPRYQNSLQVGFSIIYLALYTGAINTINPTGDLDAVEGLLYLMTLAFVIDELSKFYKVGRWYIGFWNIFNSTLYTLMTISFILRMIAVSHSPSEGTHIRTLFHTHHATPGPREHFNILSYNFLAFTAPMFWMRLMLYFDTFPFLGATLVIIKIMMKESLIFFALLAFVLAGFFQGFIGLDQVDEQIDKASFILSSMANTIMSSPDFSGFDNFAPPFGIVLFYLFSFVVMVVLLNILIALYNSSYEDITQSSTDEYMALFAQKCLQFTRAPDENVFIPPLNLIEVVGLILPFEWWVDRHAYARLNDVAMAVVYAPLLAVTAALEVAEARRVQWLRGRGEEDEGSVEEWEVTGWWPEREEMSKRRPVAVDGAAEEGGRVEGGGGGGEGAEEDEIGDPEWCEKVKLTSPDPAHDHTADMVAGLRDEVRELKEMVEKLVKANANANAKEEEEEGEKK